MGSPPRVREKLSAVTEIPLISGITPACAGKTLALSCVRLPTRDHPRVCGKNEDPLTGLPFEVGSPPRVREKLLDFDCGK